MSKQLENVPPETISRIEKAIRIKLPLRLIAKSYEISLHTVRSIKERMG